jgi:hypothetical protein
LFNFLEIYFRKNGSCVQVSAAVNILWRHCLIYIIAIIQTHSTKPAHFFVVYFCKTAAAIFLAILLLPTSLLETLDFLGLNPATFDGPAPILRCENYAVASLFASSSAALAAANF